MTHEPTVESDSRHQRSRAFVWWLALCLGLLSSGIVVQSFGMQRGIDFYHYWGIPAARALAGEEDLSSPYTNGPRYAGVLNAHADASTDKHLVLANSDRRTIDPTGTPFFYLCFAWLPLDYSTAHAWFRAGQWVSLLAAVFWFARRVGIDAGPAAAFGAATPAFFQPFHSDLNVGNVNAFQLLGCVVVVALADRVRATRSFGLGVACASLLVAAVVFKPNLAPVAVLIGCSLWSSLGLARAAGCGAIGLAVGAACTVISGAYFAGGVGGALGVWREWYGFLSGPDGAKLANYSVGEGNYSASVVFVDRVNSVDPAAATYRIALALGCGLVLSWLVAFALGRGARSVVERLRDVGGDPTLLMTTALLFVLAASPLVWLHYCVLGLLPILWCWRPGPRAPFRIVASLLALLGYGALAAPLFAGLGFRLPEYSPYAVALAWIPLWLVLLVELARPARAA